MIYQRGANGLVAEYVCSASLNALLSATGLDCRASQFELEAARDAAVARVADDLTPDQLARARAQGEALAQYIGSSLLDAPSQLGLLLESEEIQQSPIIITPVGSQTNSGSSADVVLTFGDGPDATELPISLKAYRGTVSSLGSKGSRASLARVFFGTNKISDEQFFSYFGGPAIEFDTLLKDFKDLAKEFYSTREGIAFIDRYEERKGTRKVNNPLRRKEVGDYFLQQRGFKSEHRFAELYVDMFTVGTERLDSRDQWRQFIEGMQFVLGMDRDILTLNAIANDEGEVLYVSNSIESGAYAQVRDVLVPGCSFSLIHKPGSSIITVEVAYGSLKVQCLHLAMWKDATIQFKLDIRGDT